MLVERSVFGLTMAAPERSLRVRSRLPSRGYRGGRAASGCAHDCDLLAGVAVGLRSRRDPRGLVVIGARIPEGRTPIPCRMMRPGPSTVDRAASHGPER